MIKTLLLGLLIALPNLGHAICQDRATGLGLGQAQAGDGWTTWTTCIDDNFDILNSSTAVSSSTAINQMDQLYLNQLGSYNSTGGIHISSTTTWYSSTTFKGAMAILDGPTSSGKVGIGIPLGTIASQKLHIVGTLRMVDGNEASNKVMVSDADGDASWATLGAATIPDGSVTTAKIAADAVTSAKILTASVTTVKLADDSVTTSKLAVSWDSLARVSGGNMTALENGFVGIGTTDPGNDLDVADDVWISDKLGVGSGISTPSAALHISRADSPALVIQDSDQGVTTTDGITIQTTGVDAYLVNYENGPWRFWTNGTPQMIIEAGGDVGIGTTDPTTLVDIESSNAMADLDIFAYDDGANFPQLAFRKSDSDTRGTLATTDDQDLLGRIEAYGVDSGNNSTLAARWDCLQSGAAGTEVPCLMRFLTADTNTGASIRMVIEPGGDVGIGTTNPAELLELAASSNPGGASVNTILRLTDTDTGAVAEQIVGRLEYYSSDSGSAGVIAAIEGRATDASPEGELVFLTEDSTTLAERMRIADDGKVGIGTGLNLSAKLHVHEDTTTDAAIRLSNTNAGASANAHVTVTNGAADTDGVELFVLGTGYTTAGGFVQDGGALFSSTGLSGGLSVGTRAAAPLRFYTNGHTNPRMWIESGGDVGVGITNPMVDLHVADDMTVSDKLGIGTTNPAALLHLDGGGGGTPKIRLTTSGGADNDLSASQSAGVWDIHADANNEKANSYIQLRIDGSEGMRVTSEKVGIGITNPQEVLHVNGGVVVSGKTADVEGNIQWDGSNFLGYDGADWVPLDVQTATGGGWTDDGGTVRLTTAGDSVGIGTTDTTSGKLVIDGGISLVCPAGFTWVGSNSRFIACVQTAEEGSANWPTAMDDCFDTYGGTLVTAEVGFIARQNFAAYFTDLTDDDEWYANADASAASNNYTAWDQSDGNAYSIKTENYSNSNAYRCMVN